MGIYRPCNSGENQSEWTSLDHAVHSHATISRIPLLILFLSVCYHLISQLRKFAYTQRSIIQNASWMLALLAQEFLKE